MARIGGSKLAVRRMPWHSTMTEMNHLGAALIAKPDKLEGSMTKLFTAYKYSDNPLTGMLSGTDREKTINGMAWEWDLQGATTRPLVVMENIMPAGQTKPGLNKTLFEVKLDENWWVPGDIIHPGNKEFQCRIQEPPYRHGSGWVYKVRLMKDGIGDFLPVSFLSVGKPWGKLFSQYEEASEQSGSTQYFLPQTLASRMSRYRKHYKVTGDVANEVLAVKIPDETGKMHNSWIKYAEVQYWAEWYREVERGYWYSRSTDTVLGANGRPIYSGPGVQELLEESHRHFYSKLSAKLIQEFIMDIFYSRVKPGTQRELKAFTGEIGMIQFHEALKRASAQSGLVVLDNGVSIHNTSSQYSKRSLEFGYQFTKYTMANGASLELIHNPLYDDTEINFDIDPVTGYPVESMRYTFLDVTGMGKGSNCSLMHRKGGFKHWYVAGGHNPYGPVNNGLGSHSGDYYEIHVLKQCGVHIEDVTKCGELILKRQVAI